MKSRASRGTKRFLKVACLAAGVTLASWTGSATHSLYAWNHSGAWIDQAMPSKVGNTGKVTISLIGQIPELPSKVSLWGSQPVAASAASQSKAYAPPQYEIPGVALTYTENGYTKEDGWVDDVVTAMFDLTGAPTGYYDISCLVSSDWLLYSYGAVTIDDTVTTNLWVKITGRTQVRFGASTDYSINYGNSGGVDIPSTILYLAIPKGINYTLLFNPALYQNFWPDTLKNDADLAPNFESDFDDTQYDVLPLSMGTVTPGTVSTLKVRIIWGDQPNGYLLRAFWHGSASASYNPLLGR
nr:hypothetical protein [Deltaproteobacteria bacterium]